MRLIGLLGKSILVCMGGMLFLSNTAVADDAASAEQCIERIVRAECPVPAQAQNYLRKQLSRCMHIEDAQSKQALEVLVLKPGHRVTIVQTAGAYHFKGYCQVTRYRFDSDHVREARVVTHKNGKTTALMATENGQLYALHPNQHFFELLDAQGKSYHEIKKLMPDHSGKGVQIVYNSPRPATFLTGDIVEKSAKRALVAPDPFWSLAGLED